MPERTLTLLLIRHGETLWNAEGRWQGQTDVALSEAGIAQVLKLATRLNGLWESGRLPTPCAAFSSDLSRATETARLLLEPGMGLTAQALPELRERYFGVWEGKTFAEVGYAPGSGALAPDAENYEQVMERMERALATIWAATEERGDACALVVGHGGSMRALLARAVGLGASGVHRFALANTSLSVVEFVGEAARGARGRLLRVGDTAHLER